MAHEGLIVPGSTEPIIIAGDIGGTNTRFAFGQGELDVANPLRCDTPHSYEDMIAAVGRGTSALMRGWSNQAKPDGFGAGIAGKIENGRLVQAGQLAEYGWLGKDIVHDIADELGTDPSRVVLMNDVKAAATDEQHRARLAGRVGREGIFTISTGFGGATFQVNSQTGLATHNETLTGLGGTVIDVPPGEIISDEPGHEYLRPGATCGCGKEGCIEAHVSGSGIERKFGRRGEDIPHNDPIWQEVREDLAEGFVHTLERLEKNGGHIGVVSLYGSVTFGGPNIPVNLQADLKEWLGHRAPEIRFATSGNNSGLHGAHYAVRKAIAA